jgi:hypothetical protein
MLTKSRRHIDKADPENYTVQFCGPVRPPVFSA